MVATGLPVTVVDFDCPEGTAEFVAQSYPTVNLIRVEDQPTFHHAAARNIGARHSEGDFIAFIDSDVVLSSRFKGFLDATDLSGEEFFTAGGEESELLGQCLVSRRRFDEIGGYDEAIVGWGFEDQDMFARLMARGARQRVFPPGLMSALRHGDDLRTKFVGEQKKWASQRVNSVYSYIKRDVEAVSQRMLNLAERRDLRQRVAEAVDQMRSNGGAFTFSISLPFTEASGPAEIKTDGAWRLDRQLNYTLRLG